MDKHVAGMFNTIRVFIPKIAFEHKPDSKWMKFLNVFVKIWCPTFMTDFVSVSGYTIYWPQKLEDLGPSNLSTMAHEAVHLQHRQQFGTLFNVGYLFPQCIGFLFPFGLLGLAWSPLYWLFATAIFLIPFPAPFRAYTEFKAYEMSMAMYYWVHGTVPASRVENFITSNYYFMWPFKSFMDAQFSKSADRIRSNKYLIGQPMYQAIYKYLADTELLHSTHRSK